MPQFVKGSPSEIGGVKVSNTYEEAISLLKEGKQTYTI